MTRRSFLKNIAGALAVLAVPVAVRAVAEQRIAKEVAALPREPGMPVRYEFRDGEFHEVHNRTGDEKMNSAYMNATYASVFIVHRDMVRIFA